MMKMESDSEEISAKKQHWGILQNEVYSSKYICVCVCWVQAKFGVTLSKVTLTSLNIF